MNFLHFIVYAHRNKLLKVKSWLLSSCFFQQLQDSVIDDVSSWRVARAQPTQQSVWIASTLLVLFFHQSMFNHSNVDVSFLILPLANITSIPWNQLLRVSFTEKVPEAEIGTIRFSTEWTTGITVIPFFKIWWFFLWKDNVEWHHKVWTRSQPVNFEGPGLYLNP